MSGKVSLLRGRGGEVQARVFLERAGWKILATNYRSRFGEIDIVAQDGVTLVFVEVKSRSGSFWGSAFEAVDRKKQQKIIRTALQYLHTSPLDDPFIRFDVIAVDTHGNCSHLQDAFSPEN